MTIIASKTRASRLDKHLTKRLVIKKGIRRYGHFYAPLDESLTRAVVDLSGRPGLHMDIPFTRSHVGRFDVDLFSEFFLWFRQPLMDDGAFGQSQRQKQPSSN